eukprot:70105_1
MFCFNQWFVLYSLYIVIAFLMFLSTLFGIIKYVTYFKSLTSKITTLMVMGFLHFVISSVLLLLDVIWFSHRLSICNNDSFQIERIKNAFYGAQVILVWVVLFLRLCFIFKNSVFKLSNCTKASFTITLATMPTLLIICFLPVWPTMESLYIASSVLLLLAVIISIWLTVLFSFKLYKVQTSRLNVNDDDELLSMITKNTVLATVSILVTVIAVCGNTIYVAFQSEYMLYASLFVFLLDHYTNFVCIFLTYRFCDGYYLTLCGFVDNKCRLCYAKGQTHPALDIVVSTSASATAQGSTMTASIT